MYLCDKYMIKVAHAEIKMSVKVFVLLVTCSYMFKLSLFRKKLGSFRPNNNYI